MFSVCTGQLCAQHNLFKSVRRRRDSSARSVDIRSRRAPFGGVPGVRTSGRALAARGSGWPSRPVARGVQRAPLTLARHCILPAHLPYRLSHKSLFLSTLLHGSSTYQLRTVRPSHARAQTRGDGRSRGDMAAPPQGKIRKNCSWTEIEHLLFLLGTLEHGRGAWKAVALDYVTTRTATQVRSDT